MFYYSEPCAGIRAESADPDGTLQSQLFNLQPVESTFACHPFPAQPGSYATLSEKDYQTAVLGEFFITHSMVLSLFTGHFCFRGVLEMNRHRIFFI